MHSSHSTSSIAANIPRAFIWLSRGLRAHSYISERSSNYFSGVQPSNNQADKERVAARQLTASTSLNHEVVNGFFVINLRSRPNAHQ